MKKTKILMPSALAEAARLLREGELVAFPTETVYGLGAPIFAPNSIQKIFEVKRRPQNNPLIAHISRLEQIEMIAERLPLEFFTLAQAFFPGPLTLVVKKKANVPAIVSASLNTIAVRMPQNAIARALIDAVGEPLVAPSANLSGKPSSTLAEHVMTDFDGKIAAVIDGGPCQYGMESTVVDLVSFERPTLLRLGSLPKVAIEEVLGYQIATYTNGPKSSPGMQYRHYAPQAVVTLFNEKAQLEAYLKNKTSVLVMSNKALSCPYVPLEAKTLYATLRLADQQGSKEVAILVEGCQDATLLNRLHKISALDSIRQ